MYYIVYGFFYLLSLLPFWVIYRISDGIYFLLYYVFGYRKKVVMGNLGIAFPLKTEAEKKRIAKDFYHGFVDTFIEMLKILSISEKELRKRFVVNSAEVEPLYHTGQKMEIIGGHFMNWEYANVGIVLDCKLPYLGVYMPLSNKVFDKIVLKLRAKFGTIMIPAPTFRESFLKYADQPYALVLGADQKPGKIDNAYWYNFFGVPTPFVTGPEKGARLNNTSVVYAHYYKVKRGYYNCDLKVVTTTPRDYKEGAIIKEFIGLIEDSVRQDPPNYLWTHKRWKHKWDARYSHNWMDDKELMPK